MAIGVSGASGQLGRATLRYLSERIAPSEIVAITRTPEKLEEFSKRGVTVRAGDFDSPVALTAALAGIERLLIIPTSSLGPGVRKRQHTGAIQAAGAAGVRHLIYVSTVGARPIPPGDILGTHFDTEQALFGASVPWTVLRMGPYTDYLLDAAKGALASGTYAAIAGAPAAYVTRDDVAVAAAGLLASTGHEGATYHATGPASVTHAEIADALSRLAGKKIAPLPLTIDQYEAGLASAGLPAPVVSVLSRFQTALRDGVFDVVTRDVERLGGRPAEAASEFLARSLKASIAQQVSA